MLGPSRLEDVILEVLNQLMKNCGGKLLTTQFSKEDLQVELIVSNQYSVYLTLISVDNGVTYLVTQFESIEAVEKLGDEKYLSAAATFHYSSGVCKEWSITSGSSLLALFEQHNKWSKFFGFKQVFNTN